MARRRAVETMEKDARALDMYHRGATYQAIADAIGWKNKTSAHEAVRRAIADSYRLSAEEARVAEEDRLTQLFAAFTDAMTTPRYVTGTTGNIVTDPMTGEPLVDKDPVIRAGLAVLRVSESLRKLRGLDAPARSQHEVRTVDAIDARLMELAGEVAGVDAGSAPRVPRPA